MNGKSIQLFERDDDRAVSPVIGVILMVAITVILAAVIGTFVLGLGQRVGQTAPQASLGVSVSASTNNVTVSHNGGQTIFAKNTKFTVESGGNSVTFGPNQVGNLTVGEELTLNVSSNGGAPDIVWPGGLVYGKSSGSGFNITSRDTITITVVDTQSNQIIAERTIQA